MFNMKTKPLPELSIDLNPLITGELDIVKILSMFGTYCVVEEEGSLVTVHFQHTRRSVSPGGQIVSLEVTAQEALDQIQDHYRFMAKHHLCTPNSSEWDERKLVPIPLLWNDMTVIKGMVSDSDTSYDSYYCVSTIKESGYVKMTLNGTTIGIVPPKETIEETILAAKKLCEESHCRYFIGLGF